MRTSIVAITLVVSGFMHPLAAAPGVAYTVTVERSGEVEQTLTFNVVALEDRLRVSHVDAPPGEGVLYDALLRTPAGVTALNSRNGTWYPAQGSSPFAINSRYLVPHANGKIRKPSVTISPGPAAGGERTYSGEIRYEVVTVLARIACLGKFTVTTTDRIDSKYWLGRILPETRYGEVNTALRAAEGQIEGFPVSMSLDVTRTYAGGAPMTDAVEVTASEIREVEVDEAAFKRPADYRLQKPVLGFPGQTK